MDITSFLRNSSLFYGLESNSLNRIAQCFHMVAFAKDAVIFHEGVSGNEMFILTKGEISVLKDMGWGQHELKRMHPGELFGEMALISQEKRTATAKAVSEVECIEMGEADFSQLLNENAMFAQNVLRVLTDRLKRFDEIATQELVDAHQALIFSLAKLAESRDPETGAHLNRVRAYCSMLSDRLAHESCFQSVIDPGFIESIYFVSPLHDIGKVAIPDRILLKPGKLTNEEFEVMKSHTRHGAETIRTVLEMSRQAAFQMAYNIVLYHHERYDGTGYPENLSSEDIPIEARIMALADVYDALLSPRPYKPAFSYEETCKIIKESSGSHFDPYMTEVMLDNIKEFERIHLRYRDS